MTAFTKSGRSVGSQNAAVTGRERPLERSLQRKKIVGQGSANQGAVLVLLGLQNLPEIHTIPAVSKPVRAAFIGVKNAVAKRAGSPRGGARGRAIHN